MLGNANSGLATHSLIDAPRYFHIRHDQNKRIHYSGLNLEYDNLLYRTSSEIAAAALNHYAIYAKSFFEGRSNVDRFKCFWSADYGYWTLLIENNFAYAATWGFDGNRYKIQLDGSNNRPKNAPEIDKLLVFID